MLRAGASAVTITPPLGTPMSGDFTLRPAETIADDLHARALVLDDGAGRLALVVCDLIGVTAEVVVAARAAIAAGCGIPGERVMISGTHTHTGPAPKEVGSQEVDGAYWAWLAGRVADGVAVACSRLVPARVAHGAATVDGVCFNRRMRTRSGTVTMNWDRDDPELVGPSGPVDPEVTALLVEDAAGVPLALWANLALHYVGTDDDRALSADYYGHFAREVTRALGEGCVGLLSNGASGNINNIDVGRAVPLEGGARARLVAKTVAAAAFQATLMRRRHADVPLAAESVPFAVARRAVPAADVAVAEGILAGLDDAPAAPSNAFGFAVGDPVPARWVRLYAGETLAVAAMPAETTTEIQVARVGDLALAAMPGEIFVEFGLALKAGSPFARTALVSLANDDIGYVPTEVAFREGGYETWTARSSWVRPGTGEAMTARALERLRALHGPAPA